jgi:hypothetical protein
MRPELALQELELCVLAVSLCAFPVHQKNQRVFKKLIFERMTHESPMPSHSFAVNLSSISLVITGVFMRTTPSVMSFPTDYSASVASPPHQ